MATAIGMFDRSADAERAIDLLTKEGFGKDEIGVMARDDAVQAYLKDQSATAAAGDAGTDGVGGALLGGLGGLVAGIAAMFIPGIGPALAAGAFASALGLPLVGAGVGAAAGGLIGALVAANIPEEQAHVYAEGVKRGSILVMVQSSENRVSKAQAIMRDAGAVDVDERRDEWRRAGWDSFNEPPATRPRTEPELLERPPDQRSAELPRTDPLTDLEADKFGT